MSSAYRGKPWTALFIACFLALNACSRPPAASPRPAPLTAPALAREQIMGVRHGSGSFLQVQTYTALFERLMQAYTAAARNPLPAESGQPTRISLILLLDLTAAVHL